MSTVQLHGLAADVVPGRQPDDLNTGGYREYLNFTLYLRDREKGSDLGERSIRMESRRIHGGVTSGRVYDVFVNEKPRDGWWHASRIVDVQSGAVTQPEAWWKGAPRYVALGIFFIASVIVALLILSVFLDLP